MAARLFRAPAAPEDDGTRVLMKVLVQERVAYSPLDQWRPGNRCNVPCGCLALVVVLLAGVAFFLTADHMPKAIVESGVGQHLVSTDEATALQNINLSSIAHKAKDSNTSKNITTTVAANETEVGQPLVSTDEAEALQNISISSVAQETKDSNTSKNTSTATSTATADETEAKALQHVNISSVAHEAEDSNTSKNNTAAADTNETEAAGDTDLTECEGGDDKECSGEAQANHSDYVHDESRMDPYSVKIMVSHFTDRCLTLWGPEDSKKFKWTVWPCRDRSKAWFRENVILPPEGEAGQIKSEMSKVKNQELCLHVDKGDKGCWGGNTVEFKHGCKPTPHNTFRLKRRADGTFRILLTCAEDLNIKDICIDVPDQNMTQGNHLQAWNCSHKDKLLVDQVFSLGLPKADLEAFNRLSVTTHTDNEPCALQVFNRDLKAFAGRCGVSDDAGPLIVRLAQAEVAVGQSVVRPTPTRSSVWLLWCNATGCSCNGLDPTQTLVPVPRENRTLACGVLMLKAHSPGSHCPDEFAAVRDVFWRDGQVHCELGRLAAQRLQSQDKEAHPRELRFLLVRIVALLKRDVEAFEGLSLSNTSGVCDISNSTSAHRPHQELSVTCSRHEGGSEVGLAVVQENRSNEDWVLHGSVWGLWCFHDECACQAVDVGEDVFSRPVHLKLGEEGCAVLMLSTMSKFSECPGDLADLRRSIEEPNLQGIDCAAALAGVHKLAAEKAKRRLIRLKFVHISRSEHPLTRFTKGALNVFSLLGGAFVLASVPAWPATAKLAQFMVVLAGNRAELGVPEEFGEFAHKFTKFDSLVKSLKELGLRQKHLLPRWVRFLDPATWWTMRERLQNVTKAAVLRVFNESGVVAPELLCFLTYFFDPDRRDIVNVTYVLEVWGGVNPCDQTVNESLVNDTLLESELNESEVLEDGGRVAMTIRGYWVAVKKADPMELQMLKKALTFSRKEFTVVSNMLLSLLVLPGLLLLYTVLYFTIRYISGVVQAEAAAFFNIPQADPRFLLPYLLELALLNTLMAFANVVCRGSHNRCLVCENPFALLDTLISNSAAGWVPVLLWPFRPIISLLAPIPALQMSLGWSQVVAAFIFVFNPIGLCIFWLIHCRCCLPQLTRHREINRYVDDKCEVIKCRQDLLWSWFHGLLFYEAPVAKISGDVSAEASTAAELVIYKESKLQGGSTTDVAVTGSNCCCGGPELQQGSGTSDSDDWVVVSSHEKEDEEGYLVPFITITSLHGIRSEATLALEQEADAGAVAGAAVGTAAAGTGAGAVTEPETGTGTGTGTGGGTGADAGAETAAGAEAGRETGAAATGTGAGAGAGADVGAVTEPETGTGTGTGTGGEAGADARADAGEVGTGADTAADAGAAAGGSADPPHVELRRARGRRIIRVGLGFPLPGPEYEKNAALLQDCWKDSLRQQLTGEKVKDLLCSSWRCGGQRVAVVFHLYLEPDSLATCASVRSRIMTEPLQAILDKIIETPDRGPTSTDKDPQALLFDQLAKEAAVDDVRLMGLVEVDLMASTVEKEDEGFIAETGLRTLRASHPATAKTGDSGCCMPVGDWLAGSTSRKKERQQQQTAGTCVVVEDSFDELDHWEPLEVEWSADRQSLALKGAQLSEVRPGDKITVWIAKGRHCPHTQNLRRVRLSLTPAEAWHTSHDPCKWMRVGVGEHLPGATRFPEAVVGRLEASLQLSGGLPLRLHVTVQAKHLRLLHHQAQLQVPFDHLELRQRDYWRAMFLFDRRTRTSPHSYKLVGWVWALVTVFSVVLGSVKREDNLLESLRNSTDLLSSNHTPTRNSTFDGLLRLQAQIMRQTEAEDGVSGAALLLLIVLMAQFLVFVVLDGDTRAVREGLPKSRVLAVTIFVFTLLAAVVVFLLARVHGSTLLGSVPPVCITLLLGFIFGAVVPGVVDGTIGRSSVLPAGEVIVVALLLLQQLHWMDEFTGSVLPILVVLALGCLLCWKLVAEQYREHSEGLGSLFGKVKRACSQLWGCMPCRTLFLRLQRGVQFYRHRVRVLLHSPGSVESCLPKPLLAVCFLVTGVTQSYFVPHGRAGGSHPVNPATVCLGILDFLLLGVICSVLAWGCLWMLPQELWNRRRERDLKEEDEKLAKRCIALLTASDTTTAAGEPAAEDKALAEVERQLVERRVGLELAGTGATQGSGQESSLLFDKLGQGLPVSTVVIFDYKNRNIMEKASITKVSGAAMLKRLLCTAKAWSLSYRRDLHLRTPVETSLQSLSTETARDARELVCTLQVIGHSDIILGCTDMNDSILTLWRDQALDGSETQLGRWVKRVRKFFVDHGTAGPHIDTILASLFFGPSWKPRETEPIPDPGEVAGAGSGESLQWPLVWQQYSSSQEPSEPELLHVVVAAEELRPGTRLLPLLCTRGTELAPERTATAAGADAEPPAAPEEGEFDIEFRKILGRPIGLDVVVQTADLEICDLKTGLITDWNRDNPTKVVRLGDRIVTVNGVSGDGCELATVMKRDNHLKMLIRHQTT